MHQSLIRMRSSGRGLLAALVLAAAPTFADPGQQSVWRFDFAVGAVKQFETSLDLGGEFDIDRYFLNLNATRLLNTEWSAGLSLGYGEDAYGFKGVLPFGGGEAPWRRIRELRISVPLTHRGESWTTIAIPSLRYSGESSAAWSDSQQMGVLAGTAYRFSDRLSIGPGFGVFSEIEDSVGFFPILLLDWKLSDQLSLETGRGVAASRGPGLSLNWNPSEAWKLALGVRYEKFRFRLDEDGQVANGVGQNRAIPVTLLLSYQPGPDLQMNLLGGVAYAGELQLEDADGNFLQDAEYDDAPYLGLLMNIRM